MPLFCQKQDTDSFLESGEHNYAILHEAMDLFIAEVATLITQDPGKVRGYIDDILKGLDLKNLTSVYFDNSQKTYCILILKRIAKEYPDMYLAKDLTKTFACRKREINSNVGIVKSSDL